MVQVLPQRLDTTLAFKAIGLDERLSGADKRVAVAILDSFNRKTGQCDPSLDRIAHLVGVSRRSVIRSVKRLEAARYLRKCRHGGKSHRNSYEPNWPRFREVEVGWSARKKTRHWTSAAPDVSPSERQTCHPAGDDIVTQTLRINSSKETSSDDSRLDKQSRVSSRIGGEEAAAKRNYQPLFLGRIKSVPSAQAALAAAERRWTKALHDRFATSPDIYARVLDAIDGEVQQAATDAEVKRRGAGIRLILERIEAATIDKRTVG
jgi:hypothetical protein